MEIVKKDKNEFALEGLIPNDGGCWLVVGDAHVRIHRSDEGLIIDVHTATREESVSSTYVFDSELE